jgi:hypothetical protein
LTSIFGHGFNFDKPATGTSDARGVHAQRILFVGWFLLVFKARAFLA